MSDLHTFGAHSGRIEGDLAIVYFVGPVQFPEARQIFALFEQVISVHGHVYAIAHIEQAGTVAPEVRRELSAWMKTHNFMAMANVKGSVVSRSLGLLLSNALRLLGYLHFSAGFFDSEAEARRWIAQIKEKQAGRQPRL